MSSRVFNPQQQSVYQQQQALIAARQAEFEAEQAAIEQSAVAIGGEVTEGVPLTVDDFDKHTSRTYYVTLEGSLNDLHRGTIKAEWHAEEGAEHIYQRIAGVIDGKPVYQGDTTKGVILGMRLEKVVSSFPIDIGVNITGVHGSEYTKDGKSYAFIAIAKESDAPNKCLFKPISPITREMMEKYDDTDAEKMLEHTARHQNGVCTFVDNQSPLAKMIRLNQVAFNIGSFILGEKDQGHLVVANSIVDACLERYRAVQKIRFQNFKEFKADFERVGAETWIESAGLTDNVRALQKGANGDVSSQRLTNVYKLVAKVSVDSNLVGNAPASA